MLSPTLKTFNPKSCTDFSFLGTQQEQTTQAEVEETDKDTTLQRTALPWRGDRIAPRFRGAEMQAWARKQLLKARSPAPAPAS